MRMAMPLFARVTALDAIGPYEVLQRLPDATVHFVGERAGATVRTENGFLGLQTDLALGDLVDPDVVVVPGGIGTRALDAHHPITRWVAGAHAHTRFTTSVCTGSLVLAQAGLLAGLTATTHWSCRAELDALGAVAVPQRIVEHLDRRIVTAAGVSSGIDMALRLAAVLVDDLAARGMQLMIEYDPQPPFDSGDLADADAALLERVKEYAATKS